MLSVLLQAICTRLLVRSWEHEPVRVKFGEYLSGKLLKDGDYGFMPGAQDTGYYYRVDISEEGWDKTTYVTYEHEGETLAVTVEIRRSEDGWYTSTTMNNDTYIRDGYHYSQVDPDSNVIYFGFQSTHWTLKDVDIVAENIPINGYDPADAITVKKINNNQYQVKLDPFLVAANIHVNIVARITVSDSEGYTEEWDSGIRCLKTSGKCRSGSDKLFVTDGKLTKILNIRLFLMKLLLPLFQICPPHVTFLFFWQKEIPFLMANSRSYLIFVISSNKVATTKFKRTT